MNHSAIIVVDVQNDFVEGGALAVAGGRALIPKINEFMRRAEKNTLVVFTMDWHPPNHLQFKVNGGNWPVHCVQGTKGAELVPELEQPAGAKIVKKGTLPDRDGYSGFEGANEEGRSLSEILDRHGVHRLYVCGLATDYCVRSTALDAVDKGYEAHLIASLVAGVTEDGSAKAFAEMKAKGIHIE